MGWLDILISFARLGGTATSKLNLLRPAGFSLGFWSWNSIENVFILSCWQLWHQCQILPLQRMDEKSPSSSPYNCCGLGGTKDFNQNFVGSSRKLLSWCQHLTVSSEISLHASLCQTSLVENMSPFTRFVLAQHWTSGTRHRKSLWG